MRFARWFRQDIHALRFHLDSQDSRGPDLDNAIPKFDDDPVKNPVLVGRRSTALRMADPIIRLSLQTTDDFDLIAELAGFDEQAHCQERLRGRGLPRCLACHRHEPQKELPTPQLVLAT